MLLSSSSSASWLISKRLIPVRLNWERGLKTFATKNVIFRLHERENLQTTSPENAFWVLQLRAARTWEANPWDDKIHELCCSVPYCSCKHSILHSKMLSKVRAVNIEKCQLWNSLSKLQCSSTCILPRAVGDSPIVGAITLPSCPRRTCLIWWTQVFNEQRSVIQYLAFLVVSGLALGLIYYQPLLNGAPKTRTPSISSLLPCWSISQTWGCSLWGQGAGYPLFLLLSLGTSIPLLMTKATSHLRQRQETTGPGHPGDEHPGSPWNHMWVASISHYLCCRGEAVAEGSGWQTGCNYMQMCEGRDRIRFRHFKGLAPEHTVVMSFFF